MGLEDLFDQSGSIPWSADSSLVAADRLLAMEKPSPDVMSRVYSVGNSGVRNSGTTVRHVEIQSVREHGTVYGVCMCVWLSTQAYCHERRER